MSPRGQHIGEGVPHEFADAQLPLRAAGRAFAMMFCVRGITQITIGVIARVNRAIQSLALRIDRDCVDGRTTPGMTVDNGGANLPKP